MTTPQRAARPSLLIITAIAALCGGCTSEATFDPEPPEPIAALPSHLSVTLHGAVVRPWDAAHELWDDSRQVTPEEVAELAAALAAPEAYLAVGNFIAAGLIDHWAPPDPYGSAAVMLDGAWQQPRSLGTADNNHDNTLNPVFPSSAHWSDLPYDESLRVRLTLIDEDDFLGGSDDPIGTVVLDANALAAAYRNGGNASIAVAEQGAGTLLFVNVSVARGASATAE